MKISSLGTSARRSPLAALATLFAIAGLCLCPLHLHSETVLIADDKIADEGSAWKLLAGKGAEATVSVEKVDNEPALCVEVQNDSGEEVDVRIHRLFGEIIADNTYQVTFKAKAQQAVDIIPFINPASEAARILWRVSAPLDTGWKEFRFTFKGRETANECGLGFSHLGKGTNKFWFKDIVLTTE